MFKNRMAKIGKHIGLYIIALCYYFKSHSDSIVIASIPMFKDIKHLFTPLKQTRNHSTAANMRNQAHPFTVAGPANSNDHLK